MLENKYTVWLIFAVIVLLQLFTNNVLQLHYDEAYYWVWSQHLQLSYFDHPPMVAYMIKIATLIFGNTVWAIRFAAWFCTSMACIVIYFLTLRAFGLRSANIALLLLLAWPIAQGCFFISTIDAPLLLFFSLTLYCYYRGVVELDLKYIYLGGVALGLALLSKYTAILILPALFLYILMSKNKRVLLITIHPYLSMLIALLIFSPVIIWNYQHQWISFTFQYIHGTQGNSSFNWGSFLDYWGSLLGANNPFMTIPFIALLVINRRLLKDDKIRFFLYNLVTVVSVFAWSSHKSYSEANWAAIGVLSMIVVLAYFYSMLKSTRLIWIALVPLLILFPVLKTPNLVVPNKYLHMLPAIKEFEGNQELFELLANSYLQKHPDATLFSCGYADASRIRFYLGKRVYVPSEFPFAHTYSNWNDINYSKIHDGLYLCSEDSKNNQTELHKIFNKVEELPTLEFTNDFATHHLTVYVVGND